MFTENTERKLRQQLKEKYRDEKVLVVDAKYVNDLLDGREGLLLMSRNTVYDILKRLLTKAFFMSRYLAEFNPEVRQIVPYCAVTYKTQVFTYSRISGGEERLTNKCSIGFGGHINPVDSHDPHSLDPVIVLNAAMRELQEELYGMNVVYEVDYIGMLHYKTGGVEDDHLGIAMQVVTMYDYNVRIKETDKLQGMWRDFRSVTSERDNMEVWSKALYDALDVVKMRYLYSQEDFNV